LNCAEYISTYARRDAVSFGPRSVILLAEMYSDRDLFIAISCGLGYVEQ